jgi:hypothetical protein
MVGCIFLMDRIDQALGVGDEGLQVVFIGGEGIGDILDHFT